MTTCEKCKIWARILKWKFFSLPVIAYPRSWYHDYKFYKKLKNLTPWEQHIEIRKVANDCDKIRLIGDLTRLIMCINLEDKDENMFCESKTNLLNNPTILNYPEFKEWLENINFTEKDSTIAKSLLYSFANDEAWNK